MSETGFRIFNQVFSAGAGLTYAALLTAFFRPFVPQDKRRRGLLLVFLVYILFEIVCSRAALPQGSFGLILMAILLVASKWIGLGKPSVFLLTLLYFNARISSGLMVQSLYFIVERSVPYRLEPPEAVFLRAALLVMLFLLSHADLLAVMLYALQCQLRKQRMTLHRREWHAKNTSDKVRRVMQSRGNAGISLTTNPPYGYKKDPDDKNKWVIDEPAAEVVRRIFQMCVSGLGPTQIAKQLKADKIPTPSEYGSAKGRNYGVKTERAFDWGCAIVAIILDRQEYVGDTINFRTYNKSFKQKKRYKHSKEEWKVFPNTHPAIIDRETFALVQNLRQHRRRPTKRGVVSMFSGLLFCADCGEKLYYNTFKSDVQKRPYFCCSTYRLHSDECSAHFIQEPTVEKLVLEGLQRLLWYVQVFEQKFAQEQMERFGLQEKKALTAKRRELDKANQRVLEIDQLIQKSYEDMSKGLISEGRFATFSVSLENEQKQLKETIPALETELETITDKAAALQHFIEQARKVTRLTELTPEIVHEFIEKIVVSKPDKVDGKRYQRVDIHYNTIGLWTAPEPEEMEKLFQEHLAGQRQKTA